METCNSEKACRAIEYRTHEKRPWDLMSHTPDAPGCELWYTPARYHVTVFEDKTVTGKPDFHCMVKNGRCDTLKAHKQVLEDAMATWCMLLLT